MSEVEHQRRALFLSRLQRQRDDLVKKIARYKKTCEEWATVGGTAGEVQTSVQAAALERAQVDLRITEDLIRYLAGAPAEELVEVGKVERPFRRNDGALVAAGTPLSPEELAAMPRSHKEALIATRTISVWSEWRRAT